MDYKEVYEQWLSNPYFDEATKEELKNIAEDDNEIKERFYMDLEFGTAGLRGMIGAGTNRMNIYVVRRATQGLANYISKQGGKKSQGCCDRIRFPSYVTGICRGSSSLSCSKRNQGIYV